MSGRSSRKLTRRSMVFLSFAALMALALGFGLAACGTAESPPGGGGSGSGSGSITTSAPSSSSTTLPKGSISHPTGADEVVLRVSTGGGFVPIEYNYTMIPEFTLYGDGRIIVTGPTTLQYPGPALPNLQTTVVSDETMQAILAAAKKAGLFQNGVDYGQPGVTDVGTTTITVNADGTTYTSQIYALGFEDTNGLTMEQQQARATIDDLRGKLTDPSTLTTEQLTWESYDYTALAVYSRLVDATATTGQTDVQPKNLPWPLADLATAGEEVPNSSGMRKVVVTGDDLQTLNPLLDKATQITLWQSGGNDYNLWFRPLLPDEAAGL
jgi:hypothetical protein